MSEKVKISSGGNTYLINATLIADHKAKKQAKGAVDPMVVAYSIVYGEIFDEAMASETILVDWLKTKVNWSDISENVQIEQGALVKELSLKDAQVELMASK